MVDAINIDVTPVGRFVMGSLETPNTTNFKGAPLVDQSGNPRTEWFMGIAIKKDDAGFGDLYGKIVAAGAACFPAMFPNNQCNNPKFNFKMIDGDGVDGKGQPYSNREGFAGHWVLKFSSGYAPKLYSRLDNPQAPVAEIPPNRIKRGDWVRISGSVKGNADTDYPGVYLNLGCVELVAYGDAIQGGVDGTEAFAAAAAIPAGASTTPTASAPMPSAPPAAPAPAAAAMPPAPPVAAAPAPAAVAPAPPVAAAPAPPVAAAPTPPAPPAPPVAPAPEILTGAPALPHGATMTATFPAGQTYDSMIAAGWSHQAMLDANYLDQLPT